jgi:hypothetical protein
MMNRRGFLKGLVGAGAALVLPQESEKRFFQLDRTMLSTGNKEFVDFWNDMGNMSLDKRFTHIEIEFSDVENAFIEAKRRIDRDLHEALIHGQDRTGLSTWIRWVRSSIRSGLTRTFLSHTSILTNDGLGYNRLALEGLVGLHMPLTRVRLPAVLPIHRFRVLLWIRS